MELSNPIIVKFGNDISGTGEIFQNICSLDKLLPETLCSVWVVLCNFLHSCFQIRKGLRSKIYCVAHSLIIPFTLSLGTVSPRSDDSRAS